jgi:hypothetical protein
MANDDEDRKRFEAERRRQADATRKLERGFLEAFAEWLGEIAKQVVKTRP